jgi:phosphoenolpyruvate carboxylase
VGQSDLACDHYKKLVYDTPNFVEYFRSTTPESELGNLNIGSRPSRRNNKGGVETLRAIPWVFAWTQNRCHLPVWLGVGFALQKEIENGKIEILKDMFHHWPFFNSMIDLISMVNHLPHIFLIFFIFFFLPMFAILKLVDLN